MDAPLQTQAAELRGIIDSSSTFLIVPHLNPDGDAIGSSLGLALALQAIGKQAKVCCNDPAPKNLHFLPGYDSLLLPEDLGENYKPDVAIVVDVNHIPRLGKVQPFVAKAERCVVIDHHLKGRHVPDGLLIIHPEYAACALLVYDLLVMMDVQISAEIGQCLLTGIVTDTGNFRFPNTDAKCLRAATELMERGCSLRLISDEVFDKKSLSGLRMLALALSKMELYEHGKVVVSALSHQDYVRIGVLDEETENIVNEIGRVNTSQVFALLREPTLGKVRASVRSRGLIDVAAVCHAFGGGGHRNSAGCTFEMGLEEAKALLIPALRSAVVAVEK